MSGAPNFVVIDFHTESRFLLEKTLRQKFPLAEIHETNDAEKAIEIARAVNLAAIITHRTFEMEGIELVRRLRDADPGVPVIMEPSPSHSPSVSGSCDWLVPAAPVRKVR